MITSSFDPDSPAIIVPEIKPDRPHADACVITFSGEIERYVVENLVDSEIAHLTSATGKTPIYMIKRGEKRIAFYKTFVGAPITVGLAEEAAAALDCKRFILFGGAGCLDKAIAHGRVMVPTAAYRDEGTSYHYAPAADYIEVKNHGVVADFMEKNGLPHVQGRTWTTDAFYRETRSNFEKRRAEGCISVEMECSAMQAMCDLRGLELYVFFTSGDLLDAPEWDRRHGKDQKAGTQHDAGHFTIALALAEHAAGL